MSPWSPDDELGLEELKNSARVLERLGDQLAMIRRALEVEGERLAEVKRRRETDKGDGDAER